MLGEDPCHATVVTSRTLSGSPWYHLQEKAGFFHLPKAGAHPAQGFRSKSQKCLPPAWTRQGPSRCRLGGWAAARPSRRRAGTLRSPGFPAADQGLNPSWLRVWEAHHLWKHEARREAPSRCLVRSPCTASLPIPHTPSTWDPPPAQHTCVSGSAVARRSLTSRGANESGFLGTYLLKSPRGRREGSIVSARGLPAAPTCSPAPTPKAARGVPRTSDLPLWRPLTLPSSGWNHPWGSRPGSREQGSPRGSTPPEKP